MALRNERSDDYAGWIPVIVALQAVWCLVLGRPSAPLSPNRREGLEAFTIVLLVGVVGAVGAALLDGADMTGGQLLSAALGTLLVSATLYGLLRAARSKTRDGSAARTNAVMLALLSVAALVGIAVCGLNVLATSGPAESRPFLSGLLARLGLLGCCAVLAFTVGPWPWTVFVFPPAATDSLPRATVSEPRGVERL